MRIGVYGGTFNPPHAGHLAAARAVTDLLRLDKLFLIPAGLPPHKLLPSGSPTAEQRLELTRFMAEMLGSKAEVLDMEIHREGKSYTSDTLAELKRRYPEEELWLLMGTDMFLSLHTWHEPETILSLASIAAFGRSEEDTESLFSAQRERLISRYPHARIFTMEIPDVVDISSTQLRERLAKGEGAHLLPSAVYGYILRENLYGTHADCRALPLSLLRPVALSYLKRSRVFHVLGTEQEAQRLAVLYGADVEKARRAALLHDCTKRLNMSQQLRLCKEYGIALDEIERRNVALLHARTGAEVARRVFGVDAEIYNAIRCHTTGRPEMTLLEKILYIADYIEPSRDFPGVEELRRRTYEDLDRGVALGLDTTIRFTREKGGEVHPASLRAYAFYRDR